MALIVPLKRAVVTVEQNSRKFIKPFFNQYMITTSELRIGNLISWNPKLVNPDITLSAMNVKVAALQQNKIGFSSPNFEHRVEPFEDDLMQEEMAYKVAASFEPVPITTELLEKAGFQKMKHLFTTYFETDGLRLKVEDDHFQPICGKERFGLPIQYVHQLQNIYYYTTGKELDMR